MAIIQKQGWLNRSTAPGGNLDKTSPTCMTTLNKTTKQRLLRHKHNPETEATPAKKAPFC
jgi:hypothetical protein